MLSLHELLVLTSVIFRHGGQSTFNLDIAHEAVLRASSKYSPSVLQFLFLNTNPFTPASASVHYIESIVDMDAKEKFFSVCDVMLHARHDGESFGLAVAEMSVRNKPVMTYLPPASSLSYKTHIRYLGDKGFYYSTIGELDALIDHFIAHGIEDKDYNAYRDLSPGKVIRQFESVFIKPCLAMKKRSSKSFLSHKFSHLFRGWIFCMDMLSINDMVFSFRTNPSHTANGRNYTNYLIQGLCSYSSGTVLYDYYI